MWSNCSNRIQIRPNLARYLRSYDHSLHEAKRYQDAYEILERAFSLQRELYQQDPDQHLAELGRSLQQYGIALHALERSDEACGVGYEALSLQRDVLRRDGNDATARSALAEFLNSLGVALHSAGRLDAAIAIKGEAIDVQRLLFDADPDEHRPNLATQLRSYDSTLLT